MSDMTVEKAQALLDGATPGPWLANGEPWNLTVWSSADNRVCFMAHSNGLDDDRDVATAELVAAAPDLARAYIAQAAELARLRAQVAAAYQRACEPVEANFPGTLYASNRTKAIAAILALAPADALAEVERMKAELDEYRGAFTSNNADLAVTLLKLEDAEAELARLREALGRIVGWSDAYPTQVFPEPDFARAAAALSAAGLSLDVVAASNMRYATKGCGEIARAALKGGTPCPKCGGTGQVTKRGERPGVTRFWPCDCKGDTP